MDAVNNTGDAPTHIAAYKQPKAISGMHIFGTETHLIYRRHILIHCDHLQSSILEYAANGSKAHAALKV